MDYNNEEKLISKALYGLKNMNSANRKEITTNSTVSTQCEEKSILYKSLNHFNKANAYKKPKVKYPLRPCVLNKQIRKTNHVESMAKGKLALTNYFLKTPDPTLNLSNFKSVQGGNVSSNGKANHSISNPSSSVISPRSQSENKFDQAETVSFRKRLLSNQFTRNELNSNVNAGYLKTEESVCLSHTSSTLSSPYKGKSVSSNIFFTPKKLLLIERSSFIDKPLNITSEDMLLIESKLQDMLTGIEEGFPISNQCFEWWNFYFSSTIPGNYEDYFLNSSNKKKINSYTNMELLCIMVCYCLSFNLDVYKDQLKNIKTIISLLHFNLLLIIKFIITVEKVYDFSYIKLDMMLKKSLTAIQGKDIDEFLITSLIDHNMATIIHVYQDIISMEFTNFKQRRLNNFFHYAYQNRDNMQIGEFNEFFRKYMFHESNLDGSVLASSLRNSNQASVNLNMPYLPIMVHFKYTLVLDLDETLIHVKEDHIIPNNIKVFLRPGLLPFLQKIKNRYELVVFTVGTKTYADNIINLIEEKEKFFDYRLYRHHATIVDNDFVKDLTKLGRDISHVIIIDNMPQNYRLQKSNGIFIKPYYGDNKNDTTLLHLGDILYKISNDNCDVRNSIEKYKEEIINKISLNKTD